MSENVWVWGWAITEPIDVTQKDENTYRIARVNGPEHFRLSFDYDGDPNRTMLFNGKFIDVGDDFVSYLSITDEYHDQGGTIGQTIRQEPFEETDDMGKEEPGHGYWEQGDI